MSLILIFYDWINNILINSDFILISRIWRTLLGFPCYHFVYNAKPYTTCNNPSYPLFTYPKDAFHVTTLPWRSGAVHQLNLPSNHRHEFTSLLFRFQISKAIAPWWNYLPDLLPSRFAYVWLQRANSYWLQPHQLA